MSWNHFRRSLILAGAALALSGCGAGGLPLGGDFNETSKCPVNGCAGLDPDATQLLITTGSRTQMYLTQKPGDTVEIGGDCYASSYPNNRIRVTVKLGGAVVQLGSSDIISTRSTSPLTTPRCVGGRFGFTINGASMPGSGFYQVISEIIGIDSKGVETTNPGGGTVTVQVFR